MHSPDVDNDMITIHYRTCVNVPPKSHLITCIDDSSLHQGKARKVFLLCSGMFYGESSVFARQLLKNWSWRFYTLKHASYTWSRYTLSTILIKCEISSNADLANISLVPRPPPILPFVCVYNNTWKRKTGEKRGRLRSIHHVSRREVDIGVKGPISKYIIMY